MCQNYLNLLLQKWWVLPWIIILLLLALYYNFNEDTQDVLTYMEHVKRVARWWAEGGWRTSSSHLLHKSMLSYNLSSVFRCRCNCRVGNVSATFVLIWYSLYKEETFVIQLWRTQYDSQISEVLHDRLFFLHLQQSFNLSSLRNDVAAWLHNFVFCSPAEDACLRNLTLLKKKTVPAITA